MKKLILLILIATAFQSCKIVRSLTQLNQKKAKVYSYTLFDKDIKYIPMHHLGKKAFYDDVAKKVNMYKRKGYVVYYESINTHFTDNPKVKDTIRRKVRKIKGFSGSYKENAPEGFSKKYIPQPEYSELGTDSTDVRADTNYLQFINEWEKQNGTITLDSTDLNTPFDKPFAKSVEYTNKQYKAIVVEYRNQYLIDMIKNSPDNKILILYGKGHQKDFKQKAKHSEL